MDDEFVNIARAEENAKVQESGTTTNDKRKCGNDFNFNTFIVIKQDANCKSVKSELKLPVEKSFFSSLSALLLI
jgi:hypothetical protein